MAFHKKYLLLLFDRPNEPIFIPKGKEGVYFATPTSSLNDTYRSRGSSLHEFYSKTAKEIYHVKEIEPLDLKEVSKLSRDASFNTFLRAHLDLAGKLIEKLIDSPDLETLFAKAVYARERVNSYMFNYAWSLILLHYPETGDLKLPSLVRFFPDKLLPDSVLTQAYRETNSTPKDLRHDIVVPLEFTATRSQPENRVAYFREDVGVNLHHWHWHLIYPAVGFIDFVRKDRRGELFYYMHRQMQARYDFERLCNNLPRVERLIDLHDPIIHGYFSKLSSKVASKDCPGRVENQKLHNVLRPDTPGRYDINALHRWLDRILNAIHLGYYISENGQNIKLTERTGIDILGNMIEASVLSPNQKYYGDLHNAGHVIIAAAHDPKREHKEELGVMADVTTAVRDPVFYQWHGFIDDIFQEYKKSLGYYPLFKLEYNGVKITDVSIGEDNTFHTFWEQSSVDVNYGLDFSARGETRITFTHLNHKPFSYRISVSNSKRERFGTCRIYLAPKYDEGGSPWAFDYQRLLMIELDRFVVKLNAGSNVIERKSTASTVTVPFDTMFADIGENESELYCACGWPDYMLIPKGTTEGLPCELFVMISDYTDDLVEENPKKCEHEASSFCGVRSGKYPDARPMGYPFDRLSNYPESTLQEFLTENMFVKDVSIKFKDEFH